MISPTTTAFYAALFAILYVGLSLWVVAGRVSTGILHGAGDDDPLLKRIRCHGNFAEYVPFALLLIALLEMLDARQTLLHALLLVLLIARLLHPIGMFAPKDSPRQFICRGGGILVTLLVILVAAVAILLRLA